MSRRLLWMMTALLLAGWPVNGRGAEAEPAKASKAPGVLPGGNPLWSMVAQADVVVAGEIEATEGGAKNEYGYRSLPVTVDEMLKGKWKLPQIIMQYYAEPRTEGVDVPLKTLLAMRGKKSVAFLALAEDPEGKAEFFFTGYTPDAFQSSSPEFLAEVRKEVAAQAELLRTFSTSALARPDAQHAAVKALIEQMVSEKTQAEAFEKLEAMGMVAVPSIIRLLDDPRELPVKHISLRNKGAGHFEGIRQYGPTTVLEALDAILNQMTGANFGASWFYNNDRTRKKSIDGWRVWLSHQKSPPEAPEAMAK